MSREFDTCITAVTDIKADIDDAAAFTIAERITLDMLLENLKDRNQRMLLLAETGRRKRT